MNEHPRVWLEVDLRRLRDNFRRLAAQVSPCRLMAVVKADAYGVGMKAVGRALLEAGAGMFGVATLREAVAAQEFGRPVQILGQLDVTEIPGAVDAGVIIPVTGREFAAAVAAEAKKQGKTAVCALAVDSGMGRLGMLVRNAFPEITAIADLPGIELRGIFSHFSCASAQDRPYTAGQLEHFTALVNRLAASGITFPDVHIGASGAIHYVPEARRAPFTLCRTGINLYGCGDGADELVPVTSLKARLVAIRRLPAGAGIGYERTCVLSHDTLVGTVAAGYADGIPLALSNRGEVLVRGMRCPILGRVSMDYTTIALAEGSGAEVGDEVIFFGESCGRTLAIDEAAQLKGTHPYDILCSLGNRVERIYRP